MRVIFTRLTRLFKRQHIPTSHRAPCRRTACRIESPSIGTALRMISYLHFCRIQATVSSINASHGCSGTESFSLDRERRRPVRGVNGVRLSYPSPVIIQGQTVTGSLNLGRLCILRPTGAQTIAEVDLLVGCPAWNVGCLNIVLRV